MLMHDGKYGELFWRSSSNNKAHFHDFLAPLVDSMWICLEKRTVEHQEKNPAANHSWKAQSGFVIKTPKQNTTLSSSIHLSDHQIFPVSASGTKQPWVSSQDKHFKHVKGSGPVLVQVGHAWAPQQLLISIYAPALPSLSIHPSLLSLWVGAKGFRKTVCKLQEVLQTFSSHLSLHRSYHYEGLYIQ